MATMTLLPTPLPQPSVSNTDSEELFHRLDTPAVERTLTHLLDQHDNLSFQEVLSEFDIITHTMTRWLETAHLIAFTLEQNVKQDNDGIRETIPLESACASMDPIIHRLVEIGDIIDDRTDIDTAEQRQLQFKAKMSLTKIQSEYSGLQHFISSVKKSIEECEEKNQLRCLMESILVQIDDLSLMIFQFQEKRHLNAIHVLTEDRPKEDTILMEIDNRVGPLFNDVEKAYTRMTSNNPPEDVSGILTRKHLLVQDRWECLRVEIDELKFELKEDRWLVVFKQVADQVDGMMEGLDKTVAQCYSMLQQLKSHSSSSTNPVMDINKFRSVEKNFEAKYKYYTPSIAKMLMMLGNGIAARVSRNSQTICRHESMLQRWNQLKNTMDQLRKRDLPEIESMYDRPISPAWSRLSDVSDKSQNSWKDTRFRSPEPQQQQMDMLMMMDNRPNRSKSPYKPLQNIHSPTFSTPYEDTKRTRSATPTRDNLWRNNPSPVYSRSPSQQQQRTVSPMTRDNYPMLSSGLRPSMSDSSSVSTSPSLSRHILPKTLSPTLYNTTPNYYEYDYEEDDSISTDDFRKTTKKTAMNRPKSSLKNNDYLRLPPPDKRCRTPSMIPRPKTPNQPHRSQSPSMLPRPRSSMARTLQHRQVHDSEEDDYYSPSSFLTDRTPSRQRTLHKQISSPNLGRKKEVKIAFEDKKYRPDMKDALDVEIANIVNASPITIKCQKAPQGNGRYYFGNELTPSLGGGKKIYTCKLMTYETRNRGSALKRNKVLIRVGGGWQDLEIFLLEHMNLMGSDIVVRSFVNNPLKR